jgi:peptidoglycan/LPS O-acetylase OafA/YrhL
VAFHAGLIDGGWIGVDVFFCISGFLITGLLVSEHERSGRVALGAFWLRRFRRLVPALVLLLALVSVLAWSGQVDLRSDSVWGALTYSTNWVHVVSGTSYWDQFASPDPLRHLWSLAIEEQFYIVWPVVAFVVLRRSTPHALRVVALSGAAISALVQIIGIHVGWSIDRVYQGTDTRSVAFLLGAALATRGWPPRTPRRFGRLVEGLGYLVCGTCAVLMPGDRTWIFSGPLLGVSLAGLALVHHSSTTSDRLLDARWTRAIGRWSYGIYLFHWPLVASDGLRDASSVVRFIVVSVAAVGLAALSHRFVETPIRVGRLPKGVWYAATFGAAVVVVGVVVSTESEGPVMNTSVTLAPLEPSDGSSPGDMRVMVFGDSVPAVAADELRSVFDSEGFDIDVYADPGCVPSPDERDQFGKPECVEFLRGARERATSLSIDTVVVWWGGTGAEFSWHGSDLSFCDSSSQDEVYERINMLVGNFDGVVETVILVAPVPRVDIGRVDSQGTQCEIRAYEEVGRNRGIEVVRLVDAVCPSYPQDCDRIHRYDGLHFDGDAAREVAGIILRALPSAP